MQHDWTSFTLAIGVKSTLKQLYDAWTVPAEVERWFLESCTYLDGDQPVDKRRNARPGCTYEWTWFLYDVLEKGTLTRANGKDGVEFTFAGECRVEVRLEQKGDSVWVTLTQSNIPTDEKSKFNIRIGCLEGWTFYFANLKSVYEGGLDLRNRVPELKGVNN